MNEKDYREIIMEEFLRRRDRNIAYSLIHFSKDIGINRLQLRQILSRAKGLSKQNAYRVARSLGLNLTESKEFRYLVSAQSGRSRYERNLAKQWLRQKSSSEEKQAFRAKKEINLAQASFSASALKH